MAGLGDTDAVFQELGISASRVGVSIAGMIAAPCQIDAVPIANFLVVEPDARAHVAHRVAAPAFGAEIRFAAVNQATVVETTMIRFENARDGFGGVEELAFDFGVEDVGFERDRISGFVLAALRAGDDTHAAVFFGGLVNRQPERDNFHRVDHASPIGRVLMPRDAFAVAFRFTDEVAGEQRDVRSDQLADQIQHLIRE